MCIIINIIYNNINIIYNDCSAASTNTHYLLRLYTRYLLGIKNDLIESLTLFTGHRSEWDSGIPKVRIQTVADSIPRLRTRAVYVGRILDVRHRAGVHQPAPPVGHLQNGTRHGPGRRCGHEAQSARRQRPPGGWHFYHARHTSWAHQRDGFHDRWESVRHDQGKLAQMTMET